VLKLCGMLRLGSPAIMSSQKVLVGSLLNQVSEIVDPNMVKVLHGQELGLLYVCFQCQSYHLTHTMIGLMAGSPHPKMLYMHCAQT